MKLKIFFLSLLASSSSFAQQADSTLIGGSFQEVGQYIQQQTTQQQSVCPSAVLQWGNSGVYCKQAIAEASEGNEAYLIDQDPSDSSAGSARFFCQSGNWIMTSGNCSSPQTVTQTDPVIKTVDQSPYVVPEAEAQTDPKNCYGYFNGICMTNGNANDTPVATPAPDPHAGKTYCADQNHTTCTIRYGSGNFWY